MKMTKRLWALTLALVMTMTALAGCGGTGTQSSSSGAGSGSSDPGESMDLAGVTDPYLAVSGLAGDTVVARLGDEDITAAMLLYWLSLAGDTQEALEAASFHAQLHQLARQEGLTPDPAIAQELEQEYASITAQVGDEALVDHVLWANLLTRDLLAYFNESSDLYDQLAELYFGENSGSYPTDAEVMAFLDEGGYFKVKHILLMTADQITQQPLDDETIAQKKAQADDFLSQLRAAEDPMTLFDQLMNEYSEDGGLLTNPDGYIFSAEDSLVGGFREATLALQPGEISDVVETYYGYHIMLRLPIDPDGYRDQVISQRLDERLEELRDALPLDTTEELDKLDLTSFLEKLDALQASVYDEIQASQEAQEESQEDGASSSSQG